MRKRSYTLTSPMVMSPEDYEVLYRTFTPRWKQVWHSTPIYRLWWRLFIFEPFRADSE